LFGNQESPVDVANTNRSLISGKYGIRGLEIGKFVRKALKYEVLSSGGF
jgi:hypothetical protein